MIFFMIVFAYLLGSVPFGFMIAKAHGKDLREIGSGNIGATNTGRVLGKKWGVICLILDTFKGLVPMLITKTQIGDDPSVGQLWLWLAVGSAAIFGHVFPVYLKFKGGKGVATSLGMVLGLFPYYTLTGVIAFGIWLIVLLTIRYVSLASITAAVAFPVVLAVLILLSDTWYFSSLWPLVIVAFAMSILVIVRHVENIKRMLEGSEDKILAKKS